MGLLMCMTFLKYNYYRHSDHIALLDIAMVCGVVLWMYLGDYIIGNSLLVIGTLQGSCHDSKCKI
jgi:hypothetical protein